MKTKAPSEWISLTEAAEIIGVVRSVVWYHLQAGSLPHEKIGNQIVIRRADAERFAETDRPRGPKPKKKS